MTPHSVVVGYRGFGRPRCLHLQGEDLNHSLTVPITFVLYQESITKSIQLNLPLKLQLHSILRTLRLNSAPRNEGVLGEWRYRSTHSLTSSLDGAEWSASHLICFTLRERAPGRHWIADWVGPRAVLDAVVKRTFEKQ